MSFFTQCKDKIEGFPKSDKVYVINPIGLVNEFLGCNCGKEYKNNIQCTKYGSIYGPVYWGEDKLKDYKYWNELVSNGKINLEEKEILIGMSENEGKLDSVQSYDSEILTVGAMQKTINVLGKGEFAVQVEEFKILYPDKYLVLFSNCGWTVENKTMYYKNLENPNSEKITGNDLKNLIRTGFNAEKYRKYVECEPLEAIIKASKDKDFQAKQLIDFIDRLKNKVLPIKPLGYEYTLEQYLKSKLGKATVLDQHINRPGYVAEDFGKALDKFFRTYPNVNKNPNLWSNKHIEYETIILNDYGKSRRGTNMEIRFDNLKGAF